MNTKVINNYSRLKIPVFLLPFFLLILIVLFLYGQNALCINEYAEIQKNSFLFINRKLAPYPNLLHNFTQFGDALVFLSLLGIFVLYAPKIWEAIISGSLVSLVFCSLLKNIFAVPRPAAVFDNEGFTIIGKRLSGCTSLPSGHSITVFTVLTVLMFALMPKRLWYKMGWIFFLIIIGFGLAFTRVGVGAHYPIDVIVGSIVGYICGLLGIFISRKYKILSWIGNKKYYHVILLLFLVSAILLITKIINENLIVFYLAFLSLVVSLYKIFTVYVKDKK
ncbi:MAG: phosphoesterase [Flavobacterium sp. 38-13]|uniref:phosphatase PAP2 family protein n=1 Tax=Flavobacterium sp. 38-13 TaxID=1896168 RepID=UPI000960CA22|nr:phosphatase PAP2 family protein [Flavobacterium sp. 38-13]OJX55668.1 MAG: phosphoesterase [Flavobacterium sp. 38-13]